MFVPPRFVVVDDKPEHLKAILNVFQELGSPCLGVVYDPAGELDGRNFDGVRVLFLDLHLIDPAATTDETRHYAIIAGILEENINPTSGPFILVVWTEHERSATNLMDYLDESLDSTKPYARPLAITSLAKDNFINIATGEALVERAEQLRNAVECAVGGNPQLAALVAWEAEIQGAAGGTLSALMELVPEEQQNTSSFTDGLNEILTRLAQGAVGRPNIANDPRSAIVSALTPILADRLLNEEVSDAQMTIWTEALTWPGREALDTIRAGKVNRMLQVAVMPSETIRSTDWGGVVEVPVDWWSNSGLCTRFGVTVGQLLGSEFKIATADRARCRPRLIRVGAACDHAQDRPGPIPYLFGLEIPCDIQRQPDNTGIVRLPASEWRSPNLFLDPDFGPFFLAVNSRYSLSAPSGEAANWQPLYRLREQLLMQLISHASNYQARPGIVQL